MHSLIPYQVSCHVNIGTLNFTCKARQIPCNLSGFPGPAFYLLFTSFSCLSSFKSSSFIHAELLLPSCWMYSIFLFEESLIYCFYSRYLWQQHPCWSVHLSLPINSELAPESSQGRSPYYSPYKGYLFISLHSLPFLKDTYPSIALSQPCGQFLRISLIPVSIITM